MTGHSLIVESLGDRYRLIEQVGAGGMSVVWRGYDEVLGRSVAIKVLSAGYVSDGAFRERMRREARAAARLCDPHVTTVYDLGEHEGAPYMVMEMINGTSLADELHDGPLPWRRTLAVCADVAAGLAAVHEAGLVHRDIKPGNVMLCPTGAKLVDFGISAEIGEEDEPAADGTLLGTPAYVAPERLTGGPVLPASDVYAVGLLLYRALTGRLPWRVNTRTELLRAHLGRPPAPLPPVPGLPDRVTALIRRCLAKDPEARPTAAELARVLASAAERRSQLRSVLRGFGALAPARALSGRSRRRTVTGAGLLAVAGVALVTLFGGVFDDHPDNPAHASAREPVRTALDADNANCQVTYQVKQDDGQQFAGALTVRNTGAVAIPESTLGFTVAGDQVVAGDGWTRDGNTIRVPAGSLAPGATRVLPFRGSYHGTNPLPARFSLGETACEPVVMGAVAAAPAAGRPPTGEDQEKKPKKSGKK